MSERVNAGRPAGGGLVVAGSDGILVRRSGDRALLVDGLAPGTPPLIRALLAVDPLPGQTEIVVGASSVLVRFRQPWPDPAALRDRAASAREAGATAPAASYELDVVYDGEDLAELADALDMSAESLVVWHTRLPWRSEFLGFAPGFAYLARLEDARAVPRHVRPRTRVPSGSVALAGVYSAVYPQDSPGGWQLIGRTDFPMWDLRRDPPALVAAGDEVRFRPVRALVQGANACVDDPPQATVTTLAARPALRVVSPGALAVVQDLGRLGMAGMGVSPSGAADPVALAEANFLVGNDLGSAGIEALPGGVELEALADVVVAVACGTAESACEPAVVLAVVRGGASSPRSPGRAFALRPGDRLRIDAGGGLRCWLALRGGVDAPRALGSRATDTLSRLGPPPLGAGDVIATSDEAMTAVGLPAQAVVHTSSVHVRHTGVGEPPSPSATGVPAAPGHTGTVAADGAIQLRVVLGPRDDWFAPAAVAEFFARDWRVDPRSNRVGIRLASGGKVLERAVSHELPSEGVIAGSVQVPAGGEPILFMADHPVTGGYPVIAVVVADDLRLAAQLAPGARVRFRNIEES